MWATKQAPCSLYIPQWAQVNGVCRGRSPLIFRCSFIMLSVAWIRNIIPTDCKAKERSGILESQFPCTTSLEHLVQGNSAQLQVDTACPCQRSLLHYSARMKGKRSHCTMYCRESCEEVHCAEPLESRAKKAGLYWLFHT